MEVTQQLLEMACVEHAYSVDYATYVDNTPL